MRKCTGNNTQEWGVDAIFNVECTNCGNSVEFFKDEIIRSCPECKRTVVSAHPEMVVLPDFCVRLKF